MTLASAPYHPLHMTYEASVLRSSRPVDASVQAAHIERLAKIKALGSQQNQCIDCGLLLSANCGKRRCVGCSVRQNKHYNDKRKRKRINSAYNHMDGSTPKPPTE